jgi:uncharacterized Zn finger protein
MKALLARVLDQRTLCRMAGARSFERGEAYFASGRVVALAEHERKVRKVRDLMTRLGREAEFDRYVETVRTAHKAKRNFMKLIEQMK